MSGWILIYFAQTTLVSANRVAAHRKFGMFGAGYALLVVVFGTTATFLSARREVRGHTDAAFSFLNVLGLELAQMFLFVSLVVAAIWLRNHPSRHKRLNATSHALYTSERHRTFVPEIGSPEQSGLPEHLGDTGSGDRADRFNPQP